MAYWTTTTIRSTIWPISTNEVGDTMLTQMIADGEAIVHSYLERSYTVPFTTCPDLIKGIAADVIRYVGQRRMSFKAGNLRDADIKTYEDAIAILEKIRDGVMDIPGETRKTTQTDGTYSNTMDYYPIFNVDDEANWGLDSDRADAIEEDRD